MGAIMDGRAQPSQIAGLLVGLAMKGERPDEIVGLAQAMRARATPLSRAVRAGVRHLRHRRRRRAHVQRLDGRGARARRLRRARRQARQPRGVEPLRQRRSCSRRSASNVAAPPAIVERCLDEAGIAFFFAQVWHPSMRHAAADAQRAGRAHRVQPARPADESGGRVAAAGRRVAAGADRAGRAVARRSSAPSAPGSCTARTASTRSRRPATPRCPSAATARSTRSTCIRPTSGLPKPRPRRCAAATPRRTPRSPGRVLAGEPGAPRDIVLLNAGASLLVAGTRRRRFREGVAMAAEAIDSGRAAGVLQKLMRCVAGGRRHDATDRRPTCSRRSSPRRGAWSRSARRSVSRGRSRARRGRPAAERADGSSRALRDGAAPRIIAECKRRSPSRGHPARSDYDPAAIATATRAPARRRSRC